MPQQRTEMVNQTSQVKGFDTVPRTKWRRGDMASRMVQAQPQPCFSIQGSAKVDLVFSRGSRETNMINNLNKKSEDSEKDDNNRKASLNVSTDLMRINAWEQLGQLIDGKKLKQPPSQLPKRQFLPSRARNIVEKLSAVDTGADADSESAVDIQPRSVKRKDRTPPETGTKKRREETQTIFPFLTKSKGKEHTDTKTEMGWQQLVPQDVKFTKTWCWVLKEKNLKMKILQLNINHCKVAHDLLMQTVRELKVDLAIISEPYKHLNTQPLTQSAKQYSLVVIAGDFNAWAVDWDSKETNARENALLEAMAILDVVLLNNGDKPTFVRKKVNSIVDFTFVSCCLVKGNLSWKVMDIYTASDHSALLWEYFKLPRVFKQINSELE
ncbi:hypothetical protein HELRODRAFT_178236 [Helobdella robusta]|uniref:Endonuclease/exonuclease/phosphatase domain-containing protein n=1 Tax=Helobdella robusta TaxID=6412 RepID=T1FCZ4_HELRO|nr:hypothetical protein HELRODRAFT_178236 [Helobdella robusta]ESN97439.1 hypothetical protein HELRODRAFT_178236 [Helobdella robusta]